MTALENVPDLIAAAQTKAQASEAKIVEIREELKTHAGSHAQMEEIRAAQVALELATVDTFTLFEARMQHHFKRGPFSRKLKSALIKAGHTDLADRLHKYYLAVNVLKHGKGASYRELLGTRTALFSVLPAEGAAPQDEDGPSALIDVSVPDFFEGLAATLLEAHQFLEAR